MTRVLVAAHMEGNPSNDGSQWVFSVFNDKHGVTPSQMAAAYHRCNEIPTAPARSVCSDATLDEPHRGRMLNDAHMLHGIGIFIYPHGCFQK